MATPQRLDAYEAWHAAKRALDEAMPWTPDWLRLRMIEQELRTAYEDLIESDRPAAYEQVVQNGDAQHGGVEGRGAGAEPR